MNKVMTVGFAALMAAGIAGAQDEVSVVGLPPASTTTEPEVTAAAALASSYVWRGQVYNNDFVFQPQITLSHYGVSLNVWGNYNLAGTDSNGVSDDFSEIDISLAYDLPFGISDMAFTVGAIHYTFPNTPGAEATTELVLSGTISTWEENVVPIVPTISFFGDVDEADGHYILFDVNVPYEVSEYLMVKGGVSAGYGNTTYNDYYFGDGPVDNMSQDGSWNDYNIYGVVDYEILDNVVASLSLTYTFLEGGSIRDAASDVYDDKQKFWGGLNVAYDF